MCVFVESNSFYHELGLYIHCTMAVFHFPRNVKNHNLRLGVVFLFHTFIGLTTDMAKLFTQFNPELGGNRKNL